MQENSGQQEEKQAFTRKETAKVWGVSEGMVIKLDAAEKIKTIVIGRRKLVPKSEVERVLREGVPVRSSAVQIGGPDAN